MLKYINGSLFDEIDESEEKKASITNSFYSLYHHEIFSEFPQVPSSAEYLEDKTDLKQLLIGNNTEICGGNPIILGTRISVANIIELNKIGFNEEKTLEYYPHLTLEQISAALEYYNDNPDKIDTIIEKERIAEDQ